MTSAGWLAGLEQSLAEDVGGEALPIALVVLAAAAGGQVELGGEEAHGAARRALLLLAAGGDPARGLDLNGRAVSALAAELDRGERRAALARGFDVLRQAAEGLPHVSEALHGLGEEPEIAWRAFACAVLAEELGEDGAAGE